MDRSEVPQPSPALLARVATLRPVATRRPWRELASALALSWSYAALCVLVVWGLRQDLLELPRWRVLAYGVTCAAIFAAKLSTVLVPEPGEVLSRPAGRIRKGLLMLAGVVALQFLLRASHAQAIAPAMKLAVFLRHGLPCFSRGLIVMFVPVAVTLYYLRRALPLAGRRAAVEIAGAAGALAALVLHLQCPIVDSLHLGLVHGATVAVPLAGVAGVGAVLAWRGRRMVGERRGD